MFDSTTKLTPNNIFRVASGDRVGLVPPIGTTFIDNSTGYWYIGDDVTSGGLRLEISPLITHTISGNIELDNTYSEVFCNTTASGFSISLPTGSDGANYRIINTGSGNNDVTVKPSGTELLLGENSNRTLSDGSVVILTYKTNEGWW